MRSRYRQPDFNPRIATQKLNLTRALILALTLSLILALTLGGDILMQVEQITSSSIIEPMILCASKTPCEHKQSFWCPDPNPNPNPNPNQNPNLNLNPNLNPNPEPLNPNPEPNSNPNPNLNPPQEPKGLGTLITADVPWDVSTPLWHSTRALQKPAHSCALPKMASPVRMLVTPAVTLTPPYPEPTLTNRKR